MTRRNRWTRAAAAVVALLGSPATCVAAEPIKLGALLETSGFVAGLGNPGLEGARLAVDQLNAAGGINGRPVELINVNTESDETKAVTGAKRLIEQERVLAIVGPMSSGSVFAIIDTVQRSRVPLMANGASRGIVLPPDQKRGVFLAPLTDVLVQGRMLDHMKKRGITKIALLNSDVAFGTSGREQLERLAPAAGIRIVTQHTAGNADQDMTPQLAKIRASDAEATVVWVTGGFIWIATKNFNYLRLAGEAANGVYIPSSKNYVAGALSASDPQKPVIERFDAEYEKKYGRKPATFAGNGYDSVMMLAAAIRTAGDDRDKLRDALEGLKNYVGVTAVYSYSPVDHFGAHEDSVVMLQVRNGVFELVR